MISSIRFNCARFNSIQLVINLHYIPTPSPLQSKWIITTYEKKQKINQVGNSKYKNVKIYYPTTGSENLSSHSFWDTKLRFTLRLYILKKLGYIDSKNLENPSMMFSFYQLSVWLFLLENRYLDMKKFT